MKPEVVRVIRTLAKRYVAKGMMDLGTPEDTLIGTLLSARTRDTQVLKIYPAFRASFPTLRDLAAADERSIAAAISTIGLYRAKAKAIKGLANRVMETYGGKIPRTMEELLTLPGVGRKTASCVLWYGFGKPALAVDTHVFRIARRLGWTQGKNPAQVERDLLAITPKPLLGELNRTFVQFGRDICKPGTPQCWRCPVAKWCAFSPKIKEPSARTA